MECGRRGRRLVFRAVDLLHYYHLSTGGPIWRLCVEEHLGFMERSGYDQEFMVNLHGPENEAARELLAASSFDPTIIELDEEFENVSMDMIRSLAIERPERAYFYAHAKGSWHVAHINEEWRRSMELTLMMGWRDALRALESGETDLVGCHWLTPEEFPALVSEGRGPFFGGGYWMGTGSYFASLDPCLRDDRYRAEQWSATGNPRVWDLTPGWPPAGFVTS